MRGVNDRRVLFSKSSVIRVIYSVLLVFAAVIYFFNILVAFIFIIRFIPLCRNNATTALNT